MSRMSVSFQLHFHDQYSARGAQPPHQLHTPCSKLHSTNSSHVVKDVDELLSIGQCETTSLLAHDPIVGRIDACTCDELIHCKQMHLKKHNENYIVDQYLGDGVRIGCATLDDNTRTIRELFYLLIRGENQTYALAYSTPYVLAHGRTPAFYFSVFAVRGQLCCCII